MNPINSMYGQDLLLALYVGYQRRVPPIWGFLQHAWMPDLPFWDKETHSRHWPIFVFTARNREAALAWGLAGKVSVHAIGDPFLYLIRTLDRHQTTPRSPQAVAKPSTILYPYHADGRESFVAHNQALAEEIRDRFGAGVTVCLHGHDWKNERIRDEYARRDFRVICHGFGDNSHFLIGQHAELLRHDRVLSNQVGTALFHGGALGLHMEVVGPVFEQVGVETTSHEIDGWQRERYPALFDGGVSGDAARAMAAVELGGDQARGPEELADLLGWRGIARARTEVLEQVVRARRRWLP